MKLIQTLRGECRSINIAICKDDIGFAESLRGKIEKRMRTEPEYRSRWKVITVWQENDKERKQEYLFLSEVVYIESQGHKLLVRTLAEQDSYIRFPMNEAEEALGRYGFIRIHHGYLVNGERISRFEKEECIMQDGSRIPVSRGRRERALEAYKQLKRR